MGHEHDRSHDPIDSPNLSFAFLTEAKRTIIHLLSCNDAGFSSILVESIGATMGSYNT